MAEWDACEEGRPARAGEAEAVVRRNIEESRHLLAARGAAHEERSRAEAPPHDEPLRAGQDVPPDQVNIPLGGNTGSQIRDGRKRRGQG